MAEILGTPFDDNDTPGPDGVVNPSLASFGNGDVVRGLDGNDVISAFGSNTTLDGGPGDDSLAAFGNDSKLDGGADDDVLAAFGNDTTLDGGPGNDQLFSFGNNNTLNGGDGDDSLIVSGGGGKHILNGGAGNDTLTGDAGDDTLNGGLDDDLMFGGGGDDVLNGDAGNDRLRGDAGKDVLTGGAGDDELEGGADADVFKFSFTLDKEAGEAKTFKFTDWLSEKYGKDFGDELPDFERGHDHHHHGHHHHKHGGHHHHKHGGHHHHKHDGHHHHHHHGHHHHKHGGCDDHQPQQLGLSKGFFSHNYNEWLREVVVVDLLAQGFDLDANGNGRIGVRLNQYDPDGTPRIEGLTKEQLSEIFDGRDEVTLRHHYHGHHWSYSNIYKSSSSESKTTVASDDGFDRIVDFAWGEDKLELNGLKDLSLEEFVTLFDVTETGRDTDNDGLADTTDTTLALVDDSWGVTLENVAGHTLADFYNDSVLS